MASSDVAVLLDAPVSVIVGTPSYPPGPPERPGDLAAPWDDGLLSVEITEPKPKALCDDETGRRQVYSAAVGGDDSGTCDRE